MEHKDRKIDQFISKGLDQQANFSLLEPALKVMHQKKKRVSLFTFVTVGLGGLATVAVAIFIVINANFFSGVFAPNNNLVNLSDLEKSTLLTQKYEQYANLFPLELLDYEVTYNLYQKNNQDVMLEISSRVDQTSSVDEVKISIQLNEIKIKDFTKYESKTTYNFNNMPYQLYSYYLNGEYQSEGYFSYNTFNYYIDYMSPKQGNGKIFIEKVLETLDKEQ